MRSKIIVSGDNSKTLLIPALNETYHSTNGAVTEAKHIFINAGFKHRVKKSMHVFEMGFGTGLNALVTLDESIRNGITTTYETIEAYPIDLQLAIDLDYIQALGVEDLENEFTTMHTCSPDKKVKLNDNFSFKKVIDRIENYSLAADCFDIIYFDAFAPQVQPNLWEIAVLQNMWNGLKKDGVLVTYCAQGQFKRNLKDVGFELESIPGPPGKREMTRAIK